jgi:four helix bundle protein
MGSHPVRTHRDLDVYSLAFAVAMRIFHESKQFPAEERFSLTSQVRRSSRSVCANLAEAWRKRRYEASFLSKLDDAEAEAAEVQVWQQFASECGYLPPDAATSIAAEYDKILGMLVRLTNDPEPWLLPEAQRR